MIELPWQIAETSRTMRRYYNRRASSLGVTTAQWRVLAWLGHEPGLKQVELAERLDVEPITAGRIVDRLQEAGLVERKTDPVDRRVWRLELTDKAEPIVRKLRTLAEELTEVAFAGFSADELQEAQALLARMRENIGEADEAQRKLA